MKSPSSFFAKDKHRFPFSKKVSPDPPPPINQECSSTH